MGCEMNSRRLRLNSGVFDGMLADVGLPEGQAPVPAGLKPDLSHAESSRTLDVILPICHADRVSTFNVMKKTQPF